MNKKSEQESQWGFRPYPQVERWWADYKRDPHHLKLNQALNLGLGKFMGKGDIELQDLYNVMRGLKNK